MIRALALTVTTVTVLFCGSQHAFAADWLEPGSYPEADSEQSGELHTFGEARKLKGISALEIPDIAGMASTKSGNGHWLASADGQVFTYDLDDIANYYLNYLKLMDHWDKVLPNKVYRLNYLLTSKIF